MLTDKIRDSYRQHRTEDSRLPARNALAWARNDPEAMHPGFTWTDANTPTVLGGVGIVDGFDVRVSVTLDDDPHIDGTFTDDWSPGAVQNPEWRPGDRNRVYRYFVSGYSDADQQRKDLARAGFDRHSAYIVAQANVRDEARRAIQPEQYIITASAYREDVLLGQVKVHGFDVPEDWAQARRQFIDSAGNLIDEAVGEAAAQLAKLVKAQPTGPQLSIYIRDSYPDTDDMAESLREIAELVQNGFTSGHYPHDFQLSGEAISPAIGDADLSPDDVPGDFPVRPLRDGDSAGERVTDGTCGLSWDDAVPTEYTPAPSGRCPFEVFHRSVR
jgi:hypothetical protein